MKPCYECTICTNETLTKPHIVTRLQTAASQSLGPCHCGVVHSVELQLTSIRPSVCLRPAGEVGGDEREAGGDPAGTGHVPGDQAAGVPQVLLPVQRRPAGDPGAVAQPYRRAAPPQEVLR